MALLLNSKMLVLLGVLMVTLLANQGFCRPNDNADDLEYNNDDPAYDDDEDEDEDQHTGPPPKIETHSVTKSVTPGESVIFDCITTYADSYVHMWFNGTVMVAMDDMEVNKDPRVQRLPNNSLQLSSLNPWDSGAYSCQISTEPVQEVIHHLAVVSPAHIIKITPGGSSKTLRAGDTLSLDCETSGYPLPMVTWTRDNNKRLPGGDSTAEGRTLMIENVASHHAGMYQCKADNDVGTPDKKSIKIIVNYPPEITVESALVRSGEGEESDLLCNVHADPKAKVLWLKGGKAVMESNRIKVINAGSRHTLKISKLQREDFGEYVCHAKNSISSAEQTLVLSGTPSIPRLEKVQPEGDTGSILEWSVESFAPIEEYELHYKKKTAPAWSMAHPKVENPEGNMYSVKHSLEQLASGEYEVSLRVKNGFGWSESPVQTFEQNDNGTPAAETSIRERPDDNSATDFRPRFLVLLAVFSVSTFLL